MKHHIKPIITSCFNQQQIDQALLNMCQCGESYRQYIEQHSTKCQYQVELQKLIKKYSQKSAHYGNVDITITPKASDQTQHYQIKIYNYGTHRIIKMTQPTGDAKKVATGTFLNHKVVQELGTNYMIVWKLKDKYCQERVKVDRKDKRRKHKIASFWYQNWCTHGIIEPKDQNFNCSQFVALHDNCFIKGTCEQRITLQIYSKDGEDFDIMINGIKPTTYNEYNDEQKQKNNDNNDEANQSMVEVINALKTSLSQHRGIIDNLTQQCQTRTMQLQNYSNALHHRDEAIRQLNTQIHTITAQLNDNRKRTFDQMQGSAMRERQLQRKLQENEIIITAGLDSMNEQHQVITNLTKEIEELRSKKRRLNDI